MSADTNPSDRHGGFVVIVRSMFDHPVLAGAYDRRSAWAWLIANAAWCDHDVRTRGGVITLRRGEVIVGRRYLATRWGWTEKRVRNFTAELRQQGMLEMVHREGQYAKVAKISNYLRFQSGASIAGPPKRPAKGQRRATHNKGNKGNNRRGGCADAVGKRDPRHPRSSPR